MIIGVRKEAGISGAGRLDLVDPFPLAVGWLKALSRPLEILHLALVLFGGGTALESAEVAALASRGIDLAGIEPLLAGLELAIMDCSSAVATGKPTGGRGRWFWPTPSCRTTGGVRAGARVMPATPCQRILS